MPETTWSDGDVATAALLNQIEDQIVVTCTSSTRPTGIEGRVIYETDTDKLMIYETSTPGWRVLAGGHWENFTPSWTNLDPGNGTEGAEYRYLPGTLAVRGYVTFGTTGSYISGSVTQTVPNSETIRTVAVGSISPLGHALYRDASPAGTHGGVVQYNSTTSVLFTCWNASSTYLVANALSSSVPFTWTNADGFRYEYTVPVS